MIHIKDFRSSLLREKLEVVPSDENVQKKKPVIALSNRMVVPLVNKKNGHEEILVIRASNMHLCVRMAAKLIGSFDQYGTIIERGDAFAWEKVWESVHSFFDKAHKKNNYWVAVYHDGNTVFESGDRNPLIDLVEKIDVGHNKDYDYSIPMAQEALSKMGQDTNVALTFNFEKDEIRCGIILRGVSRTTTFSMTSSGSADRQMDCMMAMQTGAAFLEGIQLAFQAGMDTFKLGKGLIKRHSREHKIVKDSQKRLIQLSAEIAKFEDHYRVNYRPDRASFKDMRQEAEEFAASIFAKGGTLFGTEQHDTDDDIFVNDASDVPWHKDSSNTDEADNSADHNTESN